MFDCKALYAEEVGSLLETKTSLNRLEGCQDYIAAFIDKVLCTEGHCLLIHTKRVSCSIFCLFLMYHKRSKPCSVFTFKLIMLRTRDGKITHILHSSRSTDTMFKNTLVIVEVLATLFLLKLK